MAFLAKCYRLIFYLSYLLWLVCKSHETDFIFHLFLKLFILEKSNHIPKQNIQQLFPEHILNICLFESAHLPVTQLQKPSIFLHSYFLQFPKFFLEYFIDKYQIYYPLTPRYFNLYLKNDNTYVFTMPLSTENKINSNSFGLISNLYSNFSNEICLHLVCAN